MPLPQLLLERLKRRKIIQDVAPPDDGCAGHDKEPAAEAGSARDAPEVRYRAHERHAESPLCAEHEDQEEEIIAEDYSDEEEQAQGQAPEVAPADARQRDECARSEAPPSSLSPRRPQSGAGERDDTRAGLEGDQQAGSGGAGPTHSEVRYESVLGCPNKYNIYHDCSQYCVDTYSQAQCPAPTMDQRRQLALILKTFPLTSEWSIVYEPGVRTFYFWNTLTDFVSWFPPSMSAAFATLSADQIRRSMKELERSGR